MRYQLEVQVELNRQLDTRGRGEKSRLEIDYFTKNSLLFWPLDKTPTMKSVSLLHMSHMTPGRTTVDKRIDRLHDNTGTPEFLSHVPIRWPDVCVKQKPSNQESLHQKHKSCSE